jgi:hypothetical protein
MLVAGEGWPVWGMQDCWEVSRREQELEGDSGLGLKPPDFLFLILLARRFWNHTWEGRRRVYPVSSTPPLEQGRQPKGKIPREWAESQAQKLAM